MGKKRRLIIADVKSHNNNGKCTGHYFAVAQNYLDLYRNVCEVKVAGGPIYKGRFDSSDLLQLPYSSIDGENVIKNKWRVMQNCRYLFRHTDDNDVIVLQHSGASTAFLGIAVYARNCNNIYVIQYDTDALSSFIKRNIYRFARHKIKGLLCPKSLIGQMYALPHCVVTDYIYANFDKPMPNDDCNKKKYDISIIGGVAPDKGTVEAAAYLVNKNWRVLIAGYAEKEDKDRLEDIAGGASNIELHLGYISEEDYYNYIRSSKYCLLNYKGVYSERSSGVVLDILFNGVPVIGRRCAALSFIEKEGIGMLYDSIKDMNVERAMDEKEYEYYHRNLSSYLKKQKEIRDNAVKFMEI